MNSAGDSKKILPTQLNFPYLKSKSKSHLDFKEQRQQLISMAIYLKYIKTADINGYLVKIHKHKCDLNIFKSSISPYYFAQTKGYLPKNKTLFAIYSVNIGNLGYSRY